MAQFSGKITAEDGTAIDGIRGTFTVHPGAPPSWSGTLSVPAGTMIPTGLFRLDLNNGRSANIGVTSGSPDPTGGSVSFRGNGPPPV